MFCCEGIKAVLTLFVPCLCFYVYMCVWQSLPRVLLLWSCPSTLSQDRVSHLLGACQLDLDGWPESPGDMTFSLPPHSFFFITIQLFHMFPHNFKIRKETTIFFHYNQKSLLKIVKYGGRNNNLQIFCRSILV